MLLLVGTVFVTTPASLLYVLVNGRIAIGIIIAAIFIYYILATLLPVDKIIGTNQSTAVIALFVSTMYLYLARKNYWIALIPGTFMLLMVITYILYASIGFGLPLNISWIGGYIGTTIFVAIFFQAAKKARAHNLPLEEDVSGWNWSA